VEFRPKQAILRQSTDDDGPNDRMLFRVIGRHSHPYNNSARTFPIALEWHGSAADRPSGRRRRSR